MDADTYPRKDVIDVANTKFIPFVANFWEDEGVAQGYDVNGTPAQIIIAPDGDLMGRMTGYLSAGEYLAWIDRTLAEYPRMVGLRQKTRDYPDDLALRGELGLSLMALNLALPARAELGRMLDDVDKKTDRTEAERLVAARAAIAMMDSWLHSSRGDKIQDKMMFRTCKFVRDMDPENKSGMHDDAAAFEAFSYLSVGKLDPAAEIAGKALKDFETGNRHDMLRFTYGAARSHLGRAKKDPAILEDGRNTLKIVIEKHGTQRYWNQAQSFLENFQFDKPMPIPEK